MNINFKKKPIFIKNYKSKKKNIKFFSKKNRKKY
jgi:hypothetical protein